MFLVHFIHYLCFVLPIYVSYYHKGRRVKGERGGKRKKEMRERGIRKGD